LDPHGACGYAALYEGLRQGEVGIFLETAHPAKFRETVHDITGADVPVPERLAAFMQGIKQSVPMTARFEDFQAFLLSR
ncbi:MAG: threonine synthase, partial [Bacteroidaceae bacterium]|nr:threonine synthase [Bacteroidaceae bacterium]